MVALSMGKTEYLIWMQFWKQSILFAAKPHIISTEFIWDRPQKNTVINFTTQIWDIFLWQKTCWRTIMLKTMKLLAACLMQWHIAFTCICSWFPIFVIQLKEKNKNEKSTEVEWENIWTRTPAAGIAPRWYRLYIGCQNTTAFGEQNKYLILETEWEVVKKRGKWSGKWFE